VDKLHFSCSFLTTHLISPSLLRGDNFDAFMVDRQKQLLALIERAIGRAAYSGDAPEEGEDVEVDEDAIEAELALARAATFVALHEARETADYDDAATVQHVDDDHLPLNNGGILAIDIIDPETTVETSRIPQPLTDVVHRRVNSRYNDTRADPHLGDRLGRPCWRPVVGSDGPSQGVLTMSIAETLKPPPTPTRMLDAVPPDTRVVFHDVTWEAYLCYYFDLAKLTAVASAADSDNVDDFPNPDLAVEVDVSPPKIDRSGIYAALEVPEFWRARKRSVSIEQLGPGGEYLAVARSRFLPVGSDDVTRWVFLEDSSDRLTWVDRLREWVRSELVFPG
jgi:hypothetical protein